MMRLRSYKEIKQVWGTSADLGTLDVDENLKVMYTY